MLHRLVLAGALAVFAIGCTVERTVLIPTQAPHDCGGTGTELMRLEGELGADEPVWLVGVDSGRRYSVLWPDGYTAVFRPVLELRNRLGVTIARQGDVIDVAGDATSETSVMICSILSINHRSPPAEPVPTAVPVPTRRPSHVPPPLGTGLVILEVCGYAADGYEPVGSFLVRFEPLEGQPGRLFPVTREDCGRREYRVAAGRYVIEISAHGWETYRTDELEVVPGSAPSSIQGIVMRRETP